MSIPYSCAKGLAVSSRLSAKMRFDQLGDSNVAADSRMVKECETMRPFGRRRGGIRRDKSRHHLTLSQHRSAEAVHAGSLRQQVLRHFAAAYMRRAANAGFPVTFTPVMSCQHQLWITCEKFLDPF